MWHLGWPLLLGRNIAERDDQFVVTSVADASVDDGAWF
jgi:hypothetical protein